MDILRKYLPNEWILRYSLCRATHFCDPIDTCRYVLSISISTHALQYISHVIPTCYSDCIHKKSINKVNIENLTIPEATGKQLSSDKAHIVAIIHPSNNQDISSYSSPNPILDAQFLDMEPVSHDHKNSIFGRRFRVLITDETSFCARPLSNTELLRCYSLFSEHMDEDFDNDNYTTLFDDNIHYCVHRKMRASITDNLLVHVGFTDDIVFSASGLQITSNIIT